MFSVRIHVVARKHAVCRSLAGMLFTHWRIFNRIHHCTWTHTTNKQQHVYRRRRGPQQAVRGAVACQGGPAHHAATGSDYSCVQWLPRAAQAPRVSGSAQRNAVLMLPCSSQCRLLASAPAHSEPIRCSRGLEPLTAAAACRASAACERCSAAPCAGFSPMLQQTLCRAA